MSADRVATPLPPTIRLFLLASRRRMRLQAAVIAGGYGLAAGLAIGILISLAARLRPLLLPDQILVAAIGAVVAGTAIGLLYGALRRLPLTVVAARADHDLGLRERLGTALELAEGTARSALAEQHLAETAHLVETRRGERTPWPRPGREATLTLAALIAALLIVSILPNRQAAVIHQQQANQQLVQQAAAQIAQIQQRVDSRTDLDPATQRALQQQLAQLQADLASGKLDSAQAVARIAEVEAGLRRLQDPAAARGAGLPKLSDELGTFGATAPIGQKLAAGDYAGAGQALKDFANELPGLDPTSRTAIAQKLRDAAASQAATDPKLAQQLQDASDLLDQGDVAGAQAALNAAADQIGQTGQAIASQDTLSGVLGDLNAIKRDVANGLPPTTANATPQRPAGSPVAVSGSPVASNGSPIASNGTPVNLSGTPIAVSGTPGQVGPNGTPVLAQGTIPPNATPVLVQGPGQGQGSGQTPGQGQGQGQGLGSGTGGGIGTGQGNGQTGPSSSSAPAGNPTTNTGGTGGIYDYDPVYAPTLPGGAAGQQTTIPGSGGGSAPPTGTTQGPGANSPSTVPYNQVYQQYYNQALQGIDDPSIPPELRDYIRQYFTNIDPNEPGNNR